MRIYPHRLALWAFAASASFGLEFGVMGNVSAGMGGAGVALKNSPFALYYNPALLSAENSVRFGYSVGLGIREKNLDKIANIDLENFAASAEKFASLIGSAVGGGTGGVNTGAFENVLDKALGNSGATGATLADKLQNFQTQNPDPSQWGTLIDNIKKESATLPQDQKDLMDSLAGSVDFGNLEIDSKGNITNIDISFGGNFGLDKAIKDFANLKSALEENALNFTSQNGVALQFAPAFLRGTLGTFGTGLFTSFYGATSAKIDPNRTALIIASGKDYYKIDAKDGNFSYTQTTEDDYKQHSLEYALQQGNAHSVLTRGFWITEIPIGYAHTFYFSNVNWNLGVSARLMSASNTISNIALSTKTDFATEGKNFLAGKNFETKTAVAVDVGTMLEIDLPNFRYLTFGVVAKNINTPTFQYSTGEVAIKPQYRAGIAYNQNNFVFAFDVDLWKNEMLSDSFNRPFSQMIGGGVKFDIKAFDLRAGLMKDLRRDDGLIITGGVNILGFLDIAVQAGTELGEAQGYRFPRYLNVRVGGNISF